MKRVVLAALACSAMLGAAAPVSAAVVVDQSNTTVVGGFSYLNTLVTAQSFTAGMANSVGAGLFLSADFPSTPGTISISLWTGTPLDAASTMLASGSAAGAPGQWADVIWGQVALTLGQTYNIRATSNTPLVSSYGGTYAGGAAYYGPPFTDTYANFDLTFRTFSETNAVAAVPEPATWAMMLGGFGLVGGAMRYRRRQTKVTYATA